MLKQVDAIGRTGRNWPIRDGAAMAKLVKNSVSAVGSHSVTQAPPSSSSAPPRRNDAVTSDDRPNSREKENKDFHTRLFATGEDAEPRSTGNRESVAVRTSAKPVERQWGELFAEDGTRLPNAKVEGVRAGAGKNFGQNRLFDRATANDRPESPNTKKPDPTKFNHFQFGSGEDARPMEGDRPPSAKAKKHMNNWEFEDFVTPPKHVSKPLREHERHFGHGIDEVRRLSSAGRDFSLLTLHRTRPLRSNAPSSTLLVRTPMPTSPCPTIRLQPSTDNSQRQLVRTRLPLT